MQIIAWALGHVSVTDIVLVIHALTLHHFMGGDFALEMRAGKKLVLRISRTKRPNEAR